MSTIPVKARNSSTTNYDASHVYRCSRCGAEHSNPNGKFYKSPWSDLYGANSQYTTICVNCVNNLFNQYEETFDTKTACIFLCYILDVPYYFSVYDTVLKNKAKFTMGQYLKYSNGNQYRNQSFASSILSGEIMRGKGDEEKNKEFRWQDNDKSNRDYCIEVIGYDPFEDYPEEDRRFLFNQLFPYLEDDDIVDDPFKLSQILQIVDNNKQIRIYDRMIAQLDPLKNIKDIQILNGAKKDLVGSNDKIAKENEISVKNRSDKNAGKSTLTYRMRELRELDFKRAEADYYDQLRSEGTLWAIEMSNKAILQNGMFDENDKKDVYESQLKLINDLYSELDTKKEEIRLLLQKVDKLKAGEPVD